MKRYYLKEWISVEHQTQKTFCVRLGKWCASHNIGEIKDKIYVLPSISFYFNSCEYFIGFAWLILRIKFWSIDYNKENRYQKEMLHKQEIEKWRKQESKS